MSNNKNKQIFRRVVEEVIEGGDFAAFDELIDQRIVSYDPSEPEPIRGREAYRASMELYRSAFSGLHIRINDQIAEDDRWSLAGRPADATTAICSACLPRARTSSSPAST